MGSIPKSSGFHQLTVLPGMQHCYISIPEEFDPLIPSPVILALHWGGPVSNEIGKNLLEELILPGLGELNSIIVAPNRIREHWASPEAEQDLIKLWRFFQDNYLVDSEKTAITGYSMGGIGTWQMASKHPELFRAAIPISAQPPAIVTSLEWKLPTYVIHSDKDEIFPSHYTVDIVEDLLSMEADIQLNIIKDVGHFQISEFVPALSEASTWLKNNWGN